MADTETKSDDLQEEEVEEKVEQTEGEKAAEKASLAFDKEIDKELAGESEDEEETEKKPGEEKDPADDSKKEEEKKKADEEDTGKKKDEEKAPEFPEELLSKAKELGIDEDTAKSFSSPKDLLNTLTILAKTSKKPDDDKKSDDDKKKEEEVKPFDCGLSSEAKDGEEGFDQALIEAVNKMGQGFTDQITELKKGNAELQKGNDELRKSNEATALEEANRKHEDWLESQLKDLGKDYEDTFGKGSIDSLDPKSTEAVNRNKVNDELLALVAGYKTTGMKMPEKDELFKRALDYVISDKVKSVAAGKTGTKHKKRAKQTIGKPGASTEAQTKEEKVLQDNLDFDKRIEEEEAD